MAVRQPEQRMPGLSSRVGDTVVLRPTTRQRIGSAALKACCATPLLLALPVATGSTRTIVIIVALVSAAVAASIDVLAQRDIWVRVSPTGLATRAGNVPWWAIDDITVDESGAVDVVRVRSFETLELPLPAPRNGPTGSNPHFHEEVRFILNNWHRYSQVRPVDPLNLRATLDRARALAESEVIDLRPAEEQLIIDMTEAERAEIELADIELTDVDLAEAGEAQAPSTPTVAPTTGPTPPKTPAG
jgi:hypothetical protein